MFSIALIGCFDKVCIPLGFLCYDITSKCVLWCNLFLRVVNHCIFIFKTLRNITALSISLNVIMLKWHSYFIYDLSYCMGFMIYNEPILTLSLTRSEYQLSILLVTHFVDLSFEGLLLICTKSP